MNKLSNNEIDSLIKILEIRFKKNMHRHPNVSWEDILKILLNNSAKLWSINEMEKTGGEPDMVVFNENSYGYVFYDCSKETPIGRRNVCYDYEALESRKNFKPENNATDMAKEMGIELIDEKEYQNLQAFGEFDLKTSSWLKTPKEIRKLGGAIFGDRRYGRVFVYHNGAESYYGVRGFRGKLNL